MLRRAASTRLPSPAPSTGATVTSTTAVVSAGPLRHGSTYENQLSIPSLTLPKLEDTCERYLASVKPLVDPEQFSATESAVAEFLKTEGPPLHLRLKERAEVEPTSYLEKWWDDMYLGERGRIPVYYNYAYALADGPDFYDDLQIERASALLYGLLQYRKKLVNEEIEPENVNGTPLCMSQYPRLFATARIPHSKRDSLMCYQAKPSGRDFMSETTKYETYDSRHVVVFCRNQPYTVEVVTRGGTVFPPGLIEQNLLAIRKHAHSMREPVAPLGALTAGPRADWAAVRHSLLAWDGTGVDHNRASLEAIDRAIFVVCLDDSSPGSDLAATTQVFLTGVPGESTANRWFDKHMLVVCADGSAGFNMEHSTGDGTSSLPFAGAVHEASLDAPTTPASSYRAVPSPLPFSFDTATIDAAHSAASDYDAFASTVNHESFFIDNVGAELIKSKGVSPDAFFQVALQAASHRVEGGPLATYESVSMRHFYHGRTETMRSATQDAVAFARAFGPESTTPVDEQRALFKAACETHSRLIGEAKEGKGVDRHLFGLRKMAETVGMKQPAIFSDFSYAHSTTFRLSTSHVYNPNVKLFSFGPVTGDGYGVGYYVAPDKIGVNVTTFGAEAPADKMAAEIRTVVGNLLNLLE